MGFFRRRRQRKAEAAHAALLSAWQVADESLRRFLSDLLAGPSSEVPGFLLKKGEAATLDYEGAVLLEPRRQPGHYTGGYSGFSFKVTTGVRYHVGGSRGTYQPGPEVATVIDQGTLTMTNQRVVFRGAKQTREWAYAKLLGWSHDDPRPITYLQVSNRQRTSGFGYQAEHAPLVRFRLAWSMALFFGKTDQLRQSLEAELDAHQSSRPQPLGLPPSS
ncbi:MAG TPA: hypothetical protein VHI95_15030 [Acidimicrobiales bacterium]|nr:hypothetical protein [Acidimicrobiales bacterium]